MAEYVVLTDCPPGPDEQYVSFLISSFLSQHQIRPLQAERQPKLPMYEFGPVFLSAAHAERDELRTHI